MKMVKYFQAIDCPECGCCMSLDRDAHSIKCTWRDCKSRGIVFHAPTMEFELVPIERPRRHASEPVYYGAWDAGLERWSIDFNSRTVFYSDILCVAHANCREINRYWRENWPKAQVDWQVKIIGDDGLPVDLPKD